MRGRIAQLKDQTRMKLLEVRAFGVQRVTYSAFRSVVGQRALLDPSELHLMFGGKCGLEIGGPSNVFFKRNVLPIYPELTMLDIVDFSQTTLWSGHEDGGRSRKGLPPGRLIVSEALSLGAVRGEHYEVLLASHVLEHLANPFRALEVWAEVLQTRGIVVLVVPDMERTFDHNRPVTTIAHLRSDYLMNMGEEDSTHIPEILKLHDVSLDPGLESYDQLVSRCRDNIRLRSAHHHVFTLRSLRSIIDEVGLEEVYSGKAEPNHLVMILRVPVHWVVDRGSMS